MSERFKLFLLIITGTVIWSATMIKSGLLYNYGLGFWGPNAHDGLWHVALAGSFSRGSLEIPIFSGNTIRNYHIGFDLLLSVLNRLTLIPLTTLYFQILPPLLAIFIGLAGYAFVYSWKKSASQAWWSVFFIYFSGSWGFIITYLRNREFNGESLFWSQQSLSTLVNPPFALSLFVIFGGLWLLNRGLASNNKVILTATSVLFGLLIQIKVYAGLLVLAGMFMAGMLNLLMRKGSAVLKVFTGSLIVSYLLFFSRSGLASQTIAFRPFWFLETMMSNTDRLNWPKYAEAMINYGLENNLPKGIIAYFLAFLIFFLGNIGLRVIGLLKMIMEVRYRQFWDHNSVLSVTVITIGVIFPLFFIQQGTAWNTIQFFYYSLMFLGIYTGIAVGRVWEKSDYGSLKVVSGVIIILLTFPVIIATLRHYLPSRPPSRIPNEEVQALRYLRELPEGIVLTQPFTKDAQKYTDPGLKPLYLYESTAYVSSYSNKAVYLEDEVNLEITRYPWQERKMKVERVVDENSDIFNQFLKDNNITYIYWLSDYGNTQIKNNDKLELIFNNAYVSIYQTR